jgi:hypothetical protein
MKTHVVAPGDWIGAIAATYGFAQWHAIWDHEANTDLRSRRVSPDLLMVGDEVAIPEGARTGIQVPTGHRAVFTARGASDMVRIRIAGLGPLVAAMGPIEYELTVGEVVARGELTEEGQIVEAPLQAGATTAVLVLAGTERHEYAIGGLGPATEDRGVYARLANLGFTTVARATGNSGDDVDGAAPSAPEDGEAVIDPLVDAVRRFQRRVGLEPTGVIDEKTRATLIDLYGG